MLALRTRWSAQWQMAKLVARLEKGKSKYPSLGLAMGLLRARPLLSTRV
jgi:hypothetical protein